MAVSRDAYVKITISNEDVLAPDGSIDKGMLGKWDSHLNRIKKGVQSATNFNAYINNLYKKIDKDSGRAEESLFVRESELENVVATITRINKEIFGEKDERRYTVSTEKAKLFNFNTKLEGKRAQSLAEEVVTDKLGGIFEYSSAKDREDEKASIQLFATDSEIASEGGVSSMSKKLRNSMYYSLRKAKDYSNLEQQNREETEKEKKLAEALKKRKAEQRNIERAKKRKKQNKRTEQKKMLSYITLLTTLLTIVADITRRILTQTFKRASEVTKSDASAIRLGINPFIAQKYTRMERAVGLTEGTMLGASQAVLSHFGQQDRIKKEDMDILAPVIRADTAKAIEVGAGKTKPDEVAIMIINDFYKQAMAGKDWRDKYVGREQAFTNLIDRLSLFSPDMANVLSTMHYLNTSEVYGGKIKSFSDLIGLKGEQAVWNVNRKIMENLGIELTSLTAKFKTLRENITEPFAEPLAILTDWLNNAEFCMSSEEIETKRNRNRDLNAEAIKATEKEINLNKKLFSSTGFDVKSLGYKDVDDFLANADIKKIPINKFSSVQQRQEVAYYLSVHKILSKNLEQAKKDLEERKVPYRASRYTPAYVASQVGASFHNISAIDDSLFTMEDFEKVLKDTDTKYALVKLAKSRGGKQDWLEWDIPFLRRMLEEGVISKADAVSFYQPDPMWGTEEQKGLAEKYGFAWSKVKGANIERYYVQSAFERAIKENIGSLREFLKKDSEIQVTRSSFDPASRTITFELDVAGTKKSIGVLDTSNGDFHLTGGNIGDKVTITKQDLENAISGGM